MKQFSLLNENFTILNAELKDKDLMILTDLKGLIVPPQWSECNTLKTEPFLNIMYEFSSYLTGNALRHCYKNQPVNAV
jgi:hypothetical protein